MPRWKWATVASLLIVLLAVPPVAALIKQLTPLRYVVADYPMIFVARVEKVHPEKPAAILKVSDTLKGKIPFEQMPVNLAGDAEAQKEKQSAQFLKRIAPDVPIVVFAQKRGDQVLAFGYTNGTWFQLSGRGESDAKLVWSFNHFEPYFRRTFKGTTEELKKAVTDGLKGKKLPEPDEKEPPGLGPEIKSEEKPPAGNSGLPLAVVPTVVIIGPLAILAALFPTVFGGLALVMKRWTAALTISSLVSTLYFAQKWFIARLVDSWWGTQTGLWATLCLVSALGAIWAGLRFRKALRDADFETFEPRRWDYLGLGLLSAVGVGCVGFVALQGKSLLQYPWLDLVISCAPVWVATAALLFVRSGPESTVAFSLEAAFLWGLVFACGSAAALETGRGEGSGTQVVGAASRPIPRPAGMLWQFEPGGRSQIYSTPLLADDKLYLSMERIDGFTKIGVVYCLDANTGKEIWHFDNDQKMKPAFSSPSLADGKIFVGEGFHDDNNCKLFCLEAATGKKVWEFATASHTESTPVVVESKVFIGAGDDGVFCLNAADGRKIWNYPDVHVDSPPLVHDGRLYAGSGVGDKFRETLLFCLDAEKGTEIWKVPVELPAFAPPALAGNQVFFGIGNGNYDKSAEAPKGAMLCLDAANGKQLWRCDVVDTVLSKPAVDSDFAYFGARDGHCWCASRADGRVKWKRLLGSPIVSSPILIGDDAEFGTVRSLYVTTTTGRVVCLDPDNGEPFWSIELARTAKQSLAHIYATPTIVPFNVAGAQRRRIYLGADVGNDLTTLARLYCFEDEVK